MTMNKEILRILIKSKSNEKKKRTDLRYKGIEKSDKFYSISNTLKESLIKRRQSTPFKILPFKRMYLKSPQSSTLTSFSILFSFSERSILLTVFYDLYI